ncbi:sulfotransferase [Tateyamaria omphalii]|uniref:Sulfotransferase family protein n=1 Tax=Tateyamaria omphalii TaxID=299262 RepID=A0A1P8N295_9RHOB|nr:sulfotransferase [Tateyamaria omphalii]APX14309.1 hypothetical protein BWR18_20925 [Tateyamaria omphalii]
MAIGGLGGSGTRLFATVLQAAGFDIGTTLNRALDNLWFSILFKRAAWVQQTGRAGLEDREVADTIHLFYRASTSGLQSALLPHDIELLDHLSATVHPNGPWKAGPRAPLIDKLRTSKGAAQLRPWGWKEPNTHVFLPHLNHHVPGLRYIHIVRDGLDMALTTKTWQMRHWSHVFGLSQDGDMQHRQLRFWTVANRAAITFGQAYMPGRFLLVDYDDFCVRPAPHLARLWSFLGVPHGEVDVVDVAPTSIGRGRAMDLSGFAAADVLAAAALQDEVARFGRPECT